MALPNLTPEQRAEALEKAAAARKARTEALAELTAGKIAVADALAGEDPRLSKVKVHRVLRALPGIGTVRADRLMSAARIDPKRRVSGLGPVQRKALLEHLAA
jgi:transposase